MYTFRLLPPHGYLRLVMNLIGAWSTDRDLERPAHNRQTGLMNLERTVMTYGMITFIQVLKEI